MTAAPGPCAAICALTLSGLPSDRFLFAGFPRPPRARGAVPGGAALRAGNPDPATKARNACARFLADMTWTLGGTRQVVVCRELTKRFEEVLARHGLTSLWRNSPRVR
jgi:16S rRNA (cytidine1402-2'-O)-methyltransferase